MPNTYTLIASSTVGAGGASSIDFTSIPSTYTDLLVKYSLRSSGSSAVQAYLRFNSNSTGYDKKKLYGSGSAAASNSATADNAFNYIFDIDGVSQTSNTFSNGEVYIPNYTSSNYKSISADNVQENNATEAYTDLYAGLWTNTAAITAINVFPTSGSFVQYSTAYLYGVKNA